MGSLKRAVRYSDRIEIINTGYSLKPVSELGRTGPAQRNPILAAVFRDVEIAEAKGSGIRTIRHVCEEYRCPPSEFISDRQSGIFTTVLRLPLLESQTAKTDTDTDQQQPCRHNLEGSNLGLEDSKSQETSQAKLLAALPASIRQAVENTWGKRLPAERLRETIVLLCGFQAFRLARDYVAGTSSLFILPKCSL